MSPVYLSVCYLYDVAYLCDSDGLVKKLEEMEKTAGNYNRNGQTDGRT